MHRSTGPATEALASLFVGEKIISFPARRPGAVEKDADSLWESKPAGLLWNVCASQQQKSADENGCASRTW